MLNFKARNNNRRVACSRIKDSFCSDGDHITWKWTKKEGLFHHKTTVTVTVLHLQKKSKNNPLPHRGGISRSIQECFYMRTSCDSTWNYWCYTALVIFVQEKIDWGWSWCKAKIQEQWRDLTACLAQWEQKLAALVHQKEGWEQS